MEMTRKEILNSSEYWQERAETQCYTEGIDCTIQLVDKQQFIDKAAEWIDNNVNHYIFENEYGETYIKYTFTEDFIKAMKGE